mmetsp:Transcript_32647/g.100977  ORF Transcript_32647/g.100977 Transcript_32647/m.100977 type:complete len:339 (+) Transcript_32647:2632-3648(+)
MVTNEPFRAWMVALSESALEGYAPGRSTSTTRPSARRSTIRDDRVESMKWAEGTCGGVGRLNVTVNVVVAFANVSAMLPSAVVPCTMILIGTPAVTEVTVEFTDIATASPKTDASAAVDGSRLVVRNVQAVPGFVHDSNASADGRRGPRKKESGDKPGVWSKTTPQAPSFDPSKVGRDQFASMVDSRVAGRPESSTAVATTAKRSETPTLCIEGSMRIRVARAWTANASAPVSVGSTPCWMIVPATRAEIVNAQRTQGSLTKRVIVFTGAAGDRLNSRAFPIVRRLSIDTSNIGRVLCAATVSSSSISTRTTNSGMPDVCVRGSTDVSSSAPLGDSRW